MTRGASIVPVSGELFGLEPDTEYAYCLIATDVTGETLGSAVTFMTEPVAPKAPETRPAMNIATGSATLTGRLGVEAIQTSWHFEYAAGFSCTGPGAKTTPETQDATPGEPGVEVSAAVAQLRPGTEYAACLLAKNGIGSTAGTQAWFATEPAVPPTVESVAASSTSTEATVETHIDPDATTATCEVRYGTSAAYGSVVACREGLGESIHFASAHVTGLQPNTTYYFRVVAENKAGRSLPSEGTGTLTTRPPSETKGEEEHKQEKTEEKTTPITPIVSTVTPVVIPTTPVTTTTTPSTCSVSLAGARIMTKGVSEATIELTGAGTGTCQGKLVLAIKTKAKGKGRRPKMTTIGTATFSISPGKTTAVELALDTSGRALLGAAHGHLTATLTVLKSSPAPSQTNTDSVHLVQQRAAKARRPTK
jgi:hypothetical protein